MHPETITELCIKRDNTLEFQDVSSKAPLLPSLYPTPSWPITNYSKLGRWGPGNARPLLTTKGPARIRVQSPWESLWVPTPGQEEPGLDMDFESPS